MRSPDLDAIPIDYDPVPSELQDGDVVVEVGTYEGAWLHKVAEQGQYVLYGFEPASRAFAIVSQNLKGYESVTLINAALGKKNGKAVLCDRHRDGANTYGWNPEGEPSETVRVLDAERALKPLGEIAVMHLNAEGGEADVLERLIETDLIRRIRMLLVQWHPYDAEMWSRMYTLHTKLDSTHKKEARSAWECWIRKDEAWTQK